ncbi:MAG TPA: ThiF family adenylyltransferase [Candidatus Dormibacteraeota bacterium]|nr:ThiF family adenylyltransferase [Candidatus Dormibacteraeota bacterium]
MNDLHSRSRLAGYDPQRLLAARLLIVGAGAIGQNLALDLALSGVGEIWIVDFDEFEPHNATRSPLFPSAEESARWGRRKAPAVAHKLRERMTAPGGRVRYANAPIQECGELPLFEADLVLAAVDTQAARAYLAERAKLLGVPLLEAGFHGAQLNLAFFGDGPEGPCYRCGAPDKVGAFSCQRYALEAEAQGVIPAVQTGAAALAAMQAETAIMYLLGQHTLWDQRVYMDLRSLELRTVRLVRNEHCPGVHHRGRVGGGPLDVTAGDRLADLLEAARDRLPDAVPRLGEPVVMRNFCTLCGSLCDVRAPEWRWLRDTRCADCGGPWPAASGRMPGSSTFVDADDEELLALTCRQAGLAPGGFVEVEAGGDTRLLRLSGDLSEVLTEVA